LRGQRQHLRGVAGMLLLDRNDHHAPARRRRWVRIRPDDTADANAFQIVEDARRPHDDVVGADLA
jgi:hypothetical protein